MMWLCSGTSRNSRVLLFSARMRIMTMPSRTTMSRPIIEVISLTRAPEYVHSHGTNGARPPSRR